MDMICHIAFYLEFGSEGWTVSFTVLELFCGSGRFADACNAAGEVSSAEGRWAIRELNN